MFTFECKDMEMNCDYVATAASKEEVMDMAMAHAVEAHADMLQGLSDEETKGMNAKLAAAIKEEQTEEIVAEDASADIDGEGEEDTEGDEEEEISEVDGEADGDEEDEEDVDSEEEETSEVA